MKSNAKSEVMAEISINGEISKGIIKKVKSPAGLDSQYQVISDGKQYHLCIQMHSTESGISKYMVFRSAAKLSDLGVMTDPEAKLHMECMLASEKYGRYFKSNDYIRPPSHRKFEVGDSVAFGAHDLSVVLAHDDEYMFYYIRNTRSNNVVSYTVAHWASISPLKNQVSGDEFFGSGHDIRYTSTTISGLMSKAFHFGVSIPDFQRGLIWTEEQKISLLDSLFAGINIGAFIFAENKWWNGNDVTGPTEMIVDGQQRFNTIIDYISGNIKYRGCYFYELDRISQWKFENIAISVGCIKLTRDNEVDMAQILKTFVMVNRGGTTVDKSVIDAAEARLNAMKS